MLKPLANIKFPDLVNFDRNSNVEEIIARIKQDPEWSANWDGDLYQNASQMLLQYFSYLFEKNAIASNKQIRELFLNQAFSERAIYDNVAQMGVDVKQNTAASVTLLGVIDGEVLKESLIIPKYFSIPAVDLNNQAISFEIIKKENNQYNHLENIIISPNEYSRDNFLIEAHAGSTFINEFTIDESMQENFAIAINQSNIIEDSLRIYFKDTGGSLIELPYTDTFLVAPYVTTQSLTLFPDGIPYYTITYGPSGTAEVTFGSKNFGGAFTQEHVNSELIVYGRSGGGANTNIPANKIAYTTNFKLSGTKEITVSFTNLTQGAGGSDREDSQIIKNYAPHRYGRNDGHIVDISDAELAVKSYTVKHEIDTPQADGATGVPVLHAYHRIVPKRTFSDFEFPVVEDSDTAVSYLPKFLDAMNSYANLIGANDKSVVGEFISSFIKTQNIDGTDDYSFNYNLPQVNILNGTLKATAFNHLNQIVDHIQWTGNYLEDTWMTNDIRTDKAKVVTTGFITHTIMSNVNSVFKCKISDISTTLTLNISPGALTPQQLALSLQTSLVNLITLGNDQELNQKLFQYRNFGFFTHEVLNATTGLGRVVFTIPMTGELSYITIVPHGLTNTDPTTDLYTMLGITSTIYRPALETALVFDSESLFSSTEKDIIFNFNESKMGRTDTYAYDINWTQSSSNQAGPILTFNLREEKADVVTRVQPYTNVDISFKTSNGTLVDYISYVNVNENAIASPVYSETSAIAKRNSPESYFEYPTSTMVFQLKDGIEVPVYKQSFPVISQIRVRRVILSGGQWLTDDGSLGWSTYIYNNPGTWNQNILSSTGPIFSLNIASAVSAGFTTGESYRVELYTGSSVLMGSIYFINVDTANTITYTSITTVSGYAPFDLVGTHLYNPNNKMLTIYCAAPTIDDDAPAYYVNGFEAFDRIEIAFKRKSYEYITLDYRPNPYQPHGEAGALKAILSGTSRRLISLENLFKTISMVPIGINISLHINRNFSITEAIEACEDALQEYFGFENLNYQHSIGKLISEESIRAMIGSKLVGYGIEGITFNNFDYADNLAQQFIDNAYFFLTPQTLIDSIKQLETSYNNLDGFLNIFDVKVSAFRV